MTLYGVIFLSILNYDEYNNRTVHVYNTKNIKRSGVIIKAISFKNYLGIHKIQKKLHATALPNSRKKQGRSVQTFWILWIRQVILKRNGL